MLINSSLPSDLVIIVCGTKPGYGEIFHSPVPRYTQNQGKNSEPTENCGFFEQSYCTNNCSLQC